MDVTSPEKESNSTLVKSFPNPPQHCPWYSPFASSQAPTIPRLAAKLPLQSSLMEKIFFLSVKINLGSTLSKQPTFFFSSESYNRPEKDGSLHSRFLHLNPYSNFIFHNPYIEWWCETLCLDVYTPYWNYMVNHYGLFIQTVENVPKQFIFNLSLLHIDSVKHYAWLVWSIENYQNNAFFDTSICYILIV